MIGDIRKLTYFILRWTRSVRHARTLIRLPILAGVVSGLANTGLLVVISAVISEREFSNVRKMALFGGLCLLLLGTRFLAAVLLLRLSNRAIYELRVRLSRGVLASPLRRVEEEGTPRVLATLTDDIPAIAAAVRELPTTLMQLFIILGSLVYMGWLSWQGLLGFLAILILGLVTYRVPSQLAMKYVNATRKLMDTLMENFRAITEGSKELRLHHPRRQAFFSESLEPTAAGIERNTVSAFTLLLGATAWGQVLFFVMIGLVLFVLPAAGDFDTQTLVGFSVVILYMMTPLQSVLQTLPILGRASAAVEKVEQMGLLLAGEKVMLTAGESHPPPLVVSRDSWERLELCGIIQSYPGEDREPGFALGPLDLTIRRGEILFVTGGNGSGKTTLAKVLTGLYEPDAGQILLDGKGIEEVGREPYRQLFSAIFSDFFLFDRLFGQPAGELDQTAAESLSRFHLDKKVKIENGKFSTIDLSQGQRKRLALLVVYLEDRPICLFDEWAADQDPEFREIFYRQLLPELKERGKTVIVISHDDRYYDVADRVVKLDYGRIRDTGAALSSADSTQS